MEKTYIGKVEAFEIMMERGIEALPRKGREIVTCYATAQKAVTGQKDEVLGKDEEGYYIGELAS
jgi:hypothetical protein